MPELTIDYRLHLSSGIGRYLQSILPYLIREKKYDKINLLLCQENEGLEFKSSAIHRVNTISKIYSIYEQIEVPRVIPSNSDLLWVPHYNIPFFYGGIMLTTVHDLAHLALPEFFGGIHKQIYARTLFSALKYKANQIICVSEFTKQELIEFTDIKEDKVKVVYNGIEDQWYEVKKEKNPEDIPYLLFVGNVKPHKNLKTLVQAFLNIIDKVSHNLVIVGQKEGFITKDKQIDELIAKAPDRIKFTGYVSDKMLKQYYLHADIFVFPSLYEGFGYPPLEAMACGCPVIASNAASIPEICGNAAEYFSPLDVDELVEKLKKILISDTLKKELIQKGKKQAKKFTVSKTVAQTSRIVNKMLKE